MGRLSFCALGRENHFLVRPQQNPYGRRGTARLISRRGTPRRYKRRRPAWEGNRGWAGNFAGCPYPDPPGGDGYPMPRSSAAHREMRHAASVKWVLQSSLCIVLPVVPMRAYAHLVGVPSHPPNALPRPLQKSPTGSNFYRRAFLFLQINRF